MKYQRNIVIAAAYLLFIYLSFYLGIPWMANIQNHGIVPVEHWLSWGSVNYFVASLISVATIAMANRKYTFALAFATIVYLFLLLFSMSFGAELISKIQIPGIAIDNWVLWGTVVFTISTLSMFVATLGELDKSSEDNHKEGIHIQD